MKRRSAGFTLAELLVVVAIIGIIAAIAIPKLRQAVDRARQRRTMGDMRTLALAINAYGVDFVRVPILAEGNASQLRPYLTPTYMRKIPEVDGWSRGIIYSGYGLDYTLWSVGGDGVEESSPTFGATTHFAADIIMANGIFLQWPEGMQVE